MAAAGGHRRAGGRARRRRRRAARPRRTRRRPAGRSRRGPRRSARRPRPPSRVPLRRRPARRTARPVRRRPCPRRRLALREKPSRTRAAFQGCTAAGSSTRVYANVRGSPKSSGSASSGSTPSVTTNVASESNRPGGGGSGPSGSASRRARPTTRSRVPCSLNTRGARSPVTATTSQTSSVTRARKPARCQPDPIGKPVDTGEDDRARAPDDPPAEPDGPLGPRRQPGPAQPIGDRRVQLRDLRRPALTLAGPLDGDPQRPLRRSRGRQRLLHRSLPRDQRQRRRREHDRRGGANAHRDCQQRPSPPPTARDGETQQR